MHDDVREPAYGGREVRVLRDGQRIVAMLLRVHVRIARAEVLSWLQSDNQCWLACYAP